MLEPATPSVVLEERLTSRLSGRTTLTAKDEDHWEEEEEEKESFCVDMGSKRSESIDAARCELLFWRRKREEFSK